jgi:hypothetical protein
MRLERGESMNVGDLKRLLAHLPDSMEIVVEADFDEGTDMEDLFQGHLKSGEVEAQCDEKDVLYLWVEEGPPVTEPERLSPIAG